MERGIKVGAIKFYNLINFKAGRWQEIAYDFKLSLETTTNTTILV